MRFRSLRLTAILSSVVIAIALLLPMLAAAQPQATPPWHVAPVVPPAHGEMVVGDTTLDVELAVTSAQQSLGLGYRNGLDEGTGMLFVNSAARAQTFWMKGMRFCLDIIWIEHGEIVGAAENACPDAAGTADQDRARFASPGPVTYVLEVPAGWLAEHEYGTGTSVKLPDGISS